MIMMMMMNHSALWKEVGTVGGLIKVIHVVSHHVVS